MDRAKRHYLPFYGMMIKDKGSGFRVRGSGLKDKGKKIRAMELGIGNLSVIGDAHKIITFSINSRFFKPLE